MKMRGMSGQFGDVRVGVALLGAIWAALPCAATDKFRAGSGGGSFAASNSWVYWNGTDFVSASAPGSIDKAFFDIAHDGGSSGTYTVTFSTSPTCQQIGIYNDSVTFDLSSQHFRAGNDGVFVGQCCGKSASLTIKGVVESTGGAYVDDPCTLTVTGSTSELYLGTTNLVAGNVGNDPGEAKVNVFAGGKITGLNAYIGSQSGRSASLQVSGAGSRVTCTHATLSAAVQIGNIGTGSAMVENGGSIVDTYGTVGFNNGSVGSFTVTGPGSTWTNQLNFNVGRNFGSDGTLSILNGGTVTAGTTAWVGQDRGSVGRVTVDGSGSNLTTGSYLDVGSYGTGTLNITNGGQVLTNGSDAAIAWGISNNVTPAVPSIGSATVQGSGSTWTVVNQLLVGRAGNATLNVVDGGLVTAQSCLIAAAPTGSGSVLLSGVGGSPTSPAKLQVTQGLFLGGSQYVPGGQATLTLVSPAELSVGGGMNIWKRGFLESDSTIVADINNSGTIRPGVGGPGLMTVQGNFAQSASIANPGDAVGGTQIQIAGPSLAQFDRLNITGSANLAGGLFVNRINGYSPEIGSLAASVLTAAAITNPFDVVFFSPGFPDRRVMRANYQSDALRSTQSVVITVEDLGHLINYQPPGAAPLPLNGRPNQAAVGDLNGDGFIDLAVSLPRDTGNPLDLGSVLVAFNGGVVGGVWQGWSSVGSAQYTVGIDPVGVAIADVDGVPGKDLVVITRGSTVSPPGIASPALRVLLNDGSGVFSLDPTAYDVGRDPRGIAVFDADGTGRLDIAVTGLDAFDGGQITVMQNLPGPGGGYLPPTHYPTSRRPVQISPGGLDNPKELDRDLAVCFPGEGSNPDSTIGVFINAGSTGPTWNGFQPEADFAVGKRPVALAIADLDGDGSQDVMVSNADDATVSILLNRPGPAGLLRPAVDLPTGGDPASIVAVDMDLDGDPDIGVLADAASGGQRVVRVLRNDSSGGVAVFSEDKDIGAGTNPTFILPGNVDNDEDVDIVALTTGATTDTSTAYLNKYCRADSNEDGQLNTLDLVVLLQHYGQAVPTNSDGDANGDGLVNTLDLILLLQWFGQSCT